MSRMLEALKRIETGTPQPARGIRPISPEELELFGLRGDVEPPEASEPVEQATGEDCARGLPGPPVEAADPQVQGLAENVLSQLPTGRAAALAFTSPIGGEGTTDANLRRPGLADRFGIRSGGGLVEVLAGSTDWRRVVRKTGVAGLSVLPGGRWPAADDRSPERAGLAGLLDALRRDYRLVLLDAASLACHETAPMIRLCDGTYLVLRLGRTARREARQAIRAVEAAGGRVLGCVLTGG